MPVTLKCPDCGHTVQAPDDKPRTCPECEGTMKKPGYQAKSGAAPAAKPKPKTKPEPLPDDEDEPKAKKPATKPAPARPAPAASDNPFAFGDDEEADEEPKPKAKKAAAQPARKPAKKEPEPLPLDDEDEGEDADDAKGSGGSTRDARAAESLDIDPGFKNKRLMRQVEEELSRGEVLHWAGRMCPEIAERNARNMRIFGVVFAVLGAIISAVLFALAPWYAGLVPILFVLVGLALATLGPKMTMKQAELGWYAITDRRAIVYTASGFGKGGRAESFEPRELRRMRVEKSKIVDGAGDLIFKTEVHDNRTKWVDKRTGRTVKTTGSRTEHHTGFMGIENVREVETLVHNILLDGRDDDDDDENEDDE